MILPPEIKIALVGLIGTLITSLLALMGVRYQSKKNSRTTQKVEQIKAETEDNKSAIDGTNTYISHIQTQMENETTRLRKEIEWVSEQHRETRERLEKEIERRHAADLKELEYLHYVGDLRQQIWTQQPPPPRTPGPMISEKINTNDRPA